MSQAPDKRRSRVTMTERSFERVPFRFISCPDCSHQMCWVNPRLPNFCPECGKDIRFKVKERVFMRDDEAILITHNVQLAGGDYIDPQTVGL